MRFFDEKFKENKTHYILQACLAGVAVAIALAFFDVVRQPVIIASFGASAFIAFTVPKRPNSSPRKLIGGYMIGAIVGCLINILVILPAENYFTTAEYHLALESIHIMAGAAAVALSMFLMTITETEHPPAASIALGFVVNEWTLATVVFVLAGISAISLVKRIFKSWMIDLL